MNQSKADLTGEDHLRPTYHEPQIRPNHSGDIPDHIDVAIESSAVIITYIDDLNRAIEVLNEKIQNYQNHVVDLSYVYDLAKITKDEILEKDKSSELAHEAKRDVAEKKRALDYAKVDLKCAIRNSSTITGFRMSAMAALKSHRP